VGNNSLWQPVWNDFNVPRTLKYHKANTIYNACVMIVLLMECLQEIQIHISNKCVYIFKIKFGKSKSKVTLNYDDSMLVRWNWIKRGAKFWKTFGKSIWKSELDFFIESWKKGVEVKVVLDWSLGEQLAKAKRGLKREGEKSYFSQWTELSSFDHSLFQPLSHNSDFVWRILLTSLEIC